MLSCAADLVDRHDREVGVVARSVEAGFLAGVPDEQQRSLRLRPQRERFRQRHQRHRPRPVIVGAVVDVVARAGRVARLTRASACAGGTAAESASAAGRLRIADVIVVRAERDVRVFQLRVRARDDADDVAGELGADDGVVGVDVDRQLDALQRERRQRLLLRRQSFSSAYFMSDPLKRNSKNSSCAVSDGATGWS